MQFVIQLKAEGNEMGRVINYCQCIKDSANLYASVADLGFHKGGFQVTGYSMTCIDVHRVWLMTFITNLVCFWLEVQMY